MGREDENGLLSRNASEVSDGSALICFVVGVVSSANGFEEGVLFGILGMIASFVWLAVFFPDDAHGIGFDLDDPDEGGESN